MMNSMAGVVRGRAGPALDDEALLDFRERCGGYIKGCYDQLPLMKFMITFVLLFELMICYTTIDRDETSCLDHDKQF